MPDAVSRIAALSTHEREILLQRLLQTRLANAAAAAPPRVDIAGDWPTDLGPDDNVMVTVGRPGNLDTLGFKRLKREAPAAGEVEIDVHAVGLNFRDVMIALGMYPKLPGFVAEIGSECAGRVVRVGADVDPALVGQDVVGFSNRVAAYNCVAVGNVVAKPAALSFTDAATTIIATMTAEYGLRHLAGLRAGERVVIHSAAGGVGLAAVQIAQAIGAEIIATTGTPQKREYLQSLGVKHVFDSRSLSFFDSVMELTKGEGVDVVLNSLAGEAIVKGLQMLRPLGRFIELGKRDLFQNMQIGLEPFTRALSMHAVELVHLIVGRPDKTQALLADVVRQYETGALKCLKVTAFGVSEVGAAIDYMSQGTHIGKVALRVR